MRGEERGSVLRRTMTTVDCPCSETWSTTFGGVGLWGWRSLSLRGETVRLHHEMSWQRRLMKCWTRRKRSGQLEGVIAREINGLPSRC